MPNSCLKHREKYVASENPQVSLTLRILVSDSSSKRFAISNLICGLDFAKKLGIKDVATHMGFIPENPNDPQFLPLCDAIKKVAEHTKSNDQYILFETGQETPVAILRCFEQIGLDNLGVNLDTANLILYGKANPVDALDVFGKYVRNIHAKDGMYPTNGHDLGYNKYVTIEREISGEQQNTDILYAREYLSKLISEIYGG